MKTKSKLFIAIITGLLVIILGSIAFGTNNVSVASDKINLGSSETIDGLAAYSGRNVSIEGKINGTAFIAGDTVNISGDIDGDLFVAGRNVNISGSVTGNIYSAGQNVNYSGKHSRDLFVGGELVTIDGIVSRDANVAADSIIVGESLKISRNLTASSSGKIDSNVNDKVEGNVEWSEYTDPYSAMSKKDKVISNVKSGLYSIVSAFIFWLIVKAIKPRYWRNTAVAGDESLGKAFGLGILGLVVTPIILVIMMITFVGMPAAFVFGIIYLILIYISKIIVAQLIGNKIIKQKYGKELHFGIWNILLGLLIVTVITSLPYVGFIFSILLMSVGIGSVIRKIYKDMDSNDDNDSYGSIDGTISN